MFLNCAGFLKDFETFKRKKQNIIHSFVMLEQNTNKLPRVAKLYTINTENRINVNSTTFENPKLKRSICKNYVHRMKAFNKYSEAKILHDDHYFCITSPQGNSKSLYSLFVVFTFCALFALVSFFCNLHKHLHK